MKSILNTYLKNSKTKRFWFEYCFPNFQPKLLIEEKYGMKTYY